MLKYCTGCAGLEMLPKNSFLKQKENKRHVVQRKADIVRSLIFNVKDLPLLGQHAGQITLSRQINSNCISLNLVDLIRAMSLSKVLEA